MSYLHIYIYECARIDIEKKFQRGEKIRDLFSSMKKEGRGILLLRSLSKLIERLDYIFIILVPRVCSFST